MGFRARPRLLSPAMTDFIDGLVAKIDLELARTKTEIGQLNLGRQALINGSEPVAVPARRRRPAANPRKQASVVPAVVVPAGKLITTLTASGGLSSVELANATGGAPTQIRELLKHLEQEGQVRRSGHARGLRWFAVAEEDRIAQRAAEIEARMRLPKRERPHLRARARRS